MTFPKQSIFRNFEAVSQKVLGGKQEKLDGTGLHKELSSDKLFYIKASKHHRGDDFADYAGSHLLASLVGHEQAVTYELVKNRKNGRVFVASEVRPESQKLSEKNIHYRNPKFGWLGSNPKSKAAKEKIYDECFRNKPQLIKDMAKVIAGCAVVLELDCQVDNILEYTDGAGQRRICKFDNGWSLAGICKDKHKTIRLFDTKAFFGSKGSHKHKGLPTNHFKDYKKIIFSKAFINAIDEVIQNSKNISPQVDNVLEAIAQKHTIPGDPVYSASLQKGAFLDFAKHLGLKKVSGQTPTELKHYIALKLKTQLKERLHSLEVVKSLIKIKLLSKTLQKLNGNFSAKDIRNIQSAIQELTQVVKQHYARKKVKDFMPHFKPDVKKLLNQFVAQAKLCNQKKKFNIIDSSDLKFVQSLTNQNTVIPKLDAKQLMRSYHLRRRSAQLFENDWVQQLASPVEDLQVDLKGVNPEFSEKSCLLSYQAKTLVVKSAKSKEALAASPVSSSFISPRFPR